MALSTVVFLMLASSYISANSSDQSIVYHRLSSSHLSFYSNSYIIEGSTSLVLVDAHMEESDANHLRAQADSLGKPVEAIVITHRHPDHFMGLAFLYQHYPQADILVSSDMAEVISDAAKSWPDFNNKIVRLGDQDIVLAGKAFRSAILPDAESEQPLVLYESNSKTLITGDLVLNTQHLWLAEGRLDEWKSDLILLKASFEIDVLLPGHGEIGGVELINNTIRYIERFQALHNQSDDYTLAEKAMKKAFPDHLFGTALEFSLRAFGFSQ